MDAFFGVPTGRLALAALGLVALALGVLGYRGWRWPVFVRLGVRQLPRRPQQTALVAAGLMLSTALVAASLSTGDTITHSLRSAALGELGHLDEIVTYTALPRPGAASPAGGGDPFGGAPFFSLSVYQRVEQGLRDNGALGRDVTAVTPAAWLSCTLLDATTRQTANGAVRALPTSYHGAFGELEDADGRPLLFGDLQPDEMYLNDPAGASLAAKAGDEVTCVLAGVPLRWRVRAVAAPQGMGGGTVAGGLVALEHLQARLGPSGMNGVAHGANQLWIANRGSLTGAAALTDRVVAAVRPSLSDDAALAEVAALLRRADLRAALATRRASLNERTQNAVAALMEGVDRQDANVGGEGDRRGTSPRARGGGGTERGADPGGTAGGERDGTPALERALRNPGVRNTVMAAARDLPDSGVADAVASSLERATGFQVMPVKRQILELADRAGNVITTIFLLFSLLSIAAGLLLVFLIFSLLAASRRSELGIARALGTERGHLVAMFTFEGVAYALVATLLGVPAGLVVSRALVGALVWAVQSGAYGFTGAGARVAETVRWTAEPRSVALAGALGLLLTVATVAFSAWKVSRVTIVTAIRDLPEPPPARGTRPTWRSRWWWLLLPGGAALIALGLWRGQTFPFASGVSLALLFLGLLIRAAVTRRWDYAAGNRAAATVAGAALATYWALPFDAQQRVGLPRLSSGIEIFALAGIVMVAAAVWAVAANGALAQRAIAAGLTALGRPAPAVRLAAAHALRNPFGTGMTAAMFAMVVFMLTVMQVITTSALYFQGDPRVAYGGFDLTGQPAAAAQAAVQAPDAFSEAALAAAPTPASPAAASMRPEEVTAAVRTQPDLQRLVAGAGTRITGFFALLQLASPSPAWGGYTVAAIDEGFATAGDLPLQSRARGYATDGDAWRAVARGSAEEPVPAAASSTPALAIIDAGALPSPELRDRPSVAQFSFTLRGVRDAQTTMDPIPLWIGNPSGGGAARPVEVIGVIDRRTSAAFRALHVSRATFQALGQPVRPPATRLYFRVQPGADVNEARAALGAAFFDAGLQTTDLNTQFQNQSGPLLLASKLLQFFVGLGLFVGIAALGVISSRAALERRQEIGILRAIGYGRWQVGASLLCESGLVVLLGSAVGVSLALVLCRNVFAVQFFDRFQQGMRMVVPWDQLGVTVGLTCLVALAATWLPARQASRIPPMAALRGD